MAGSINILKQSSEAAIGMAVAGLSNTWFAALAIVLLFLFVLGSYALLRRRNSRRRSQSLASAIEAQSALAPRSVSDPSQRAALDKLRQRFQAGLHEFQSRGKDLFRLPWYLIIGEPGSGKTEAIRHSGVEFPEGLQNELQGSGGTVNMDWWFTNQGVILDTAGRLVFNDAPAGEAPEWIEFLRLLKKARYHCPINGLFVVLSIESLIKDSAEQITHKARRLAQQLDLIQRNLDVRFPVYLLVTKADLLAGFRAFFEDLEDPAIRHQMFGWSNPDPLDAPFRPELVGQHLNALAEGLRSRRLALLRDSADRQLRGVNLFAASPDTIAEAPTMRRSDDVDSMFALPESLLRLTPRLHRYLETLFTVGEWSPKPVFLRGIYFTSSMTEGKALDEAIALATGLPLEQLPGDAGAGHSRAYFLRDLFTEKVFRESGLVTRAANTIRLLRQRRVAILGTASVAALLFLGFATYGYGNLKQAVLDEADYWRVGALNLRQQTWSPPIVAQREDNLRLYSYRGDDRVEAADRPTLIEYHAHLQQLAHREPAGGLIFRPISWLMPGGIGHRPPAQRVLLESWVLEPLVRNVRLKLRGTAPIVSDVAALARYKEALLGLMALEADALAANPSLGADAPALYLHRFFSFLTARNFKPDHALGDVLTATYAKEELARNGGIWPPAGLTEGAILSGSTGAGAGLTNLQSASAEFDKVILQHLAVLTLWTDKLKSYAEAEQKWLQEPAFVLRQNLTLAKLNLTAPLAQIRLASNALPTAESDLSAAYAVLETAASNAAPASLLAPVKALAEPLPRDKAAAVFDPVLDFLSKGASPAAAEVRKRYYQIQPSLPLIHRDLLAPVTGQPAWERRWALYQQLWSLNASDEPLSSNDVGNAWRPWSDWTNRLAVWRGELLRYSGPMRDQVTNAGQRTAASLSETFKRKLAQEYVQVVNTTVRQWPDRLHELTDLGARRQWLAKVRHDLATASALGGDGAALRPAHQAVAAAEQAGLEQAAVLLRSRLGFPIVASATRSMEAKEIFQSRDAFEWLLAQLAELTWSNDPGVLAAREALQAEVARYKAILQPLLGKRDALAEVEITAFPYSKLTSEEMNVVRVFRWAQLTAPVQGPKEDISRSRRPLAKQTVDQPLKLVLQSQDATRTETLPAWWLFHAILSGKAEPIEEGVRWRFQVPVVDPANALNGNAVFEVRLLSDVPFPKRGDWAK